MQEFQDTEELDKKQKKKQNRVRQKTEQKTWSFIEERGWYDIWCITDTIELFDLYFDLHLFLQAATVIS